MPKPGVAVATIIAITTVVAADMAITTTIQEGVITAGARITTRIRVGTGLDSPITIVTRALRRIPGHIITPIRIHTLTARQRTTLTRGDTRTTIATDSLEVGRQGYVARKEEKVSGTVFGLTNFCS